ncbi:MAG: pyridoxamine 5'-phosphate oxidase family protein [Actinomycetota bacterium]
MARWQEFEGAAPDLAAFGRERVDGRVCFLGTIRPDGAPRVHPVTPWIAGGALFVRMYPTSPKVSDLARDDRYALHSLMDNDEGEGGEFALRGRARPVTEVSELAIANDANPEPGLQRYVVLEFSVEDVSTTVYEGGETLRRRWRA